MTLVERLANIKERIGPVGKDSKMTDGPAKYSYRGIDAILDSAHKALIDQCVVFAPNVTAITYDLVPTKSGGSMRWCSATVRYDITGPDGDPPITVTTVGEALDTSDKASNKAQTAAFKVCLSQLFAIPYSGEDPDHDRQELGTPERTVERSVVDALQSRLDALSPDLKERALEKASEAADFAVMNVRELCKNETWVAWWDGLLTKAEAKQAELESPFVEGES